MRDSLRLKFIIILVSSLLVVFTVVTIILVQNARTSFRDELNQSSEAFSELATMPIGNTFLLYQDSGRIRIEQEVASYLALNPDVENIRIIDIHGEVLYSYNETAEQHVEREAAVSFEPVYTHDSRGNITQIITPFIEDFGVHRYAVVYDVSTELSDARVSQIVGFIVGFGLLILAVTVLAVWVFTNRYILSPIQAVSNWARSVSNGNYSAPLEVTSSGREIKDLSEAVSNMADTLEKDITKLREVDQLKSEFMMITSHNLRTPITTMKGGIEMLQDAKKLSDEARQSVSILSDATKRLSLFTEGMLTIANIERGRVELDSDKKATLGEAFDAITDRFKKDAKQKGIDFRIDIKNNDEQFSLNKDFLRTIVSSLLDNALKFTSKGGTVLFNAEAQDNLLYIKVVDNGIGIAESEHEKLFTKFHRGTSTLQYDYEGTGLGLYLVKLLCDLYGGTVQVESQEGKGTTVSVVLPTA